MDNEKKLFEELLKADGINPTGPTEAESKAFENLLDEQSKLKPSKPENSRPAIWRIIMNHKMTKLAAAAMITIALWIGFYTPSPAYALEQTIKAYKSIRWVQVQVEPSTFWFECDAYGNPEHFRFYGDACSLGEITAVGYGSVADVWIPKINLCFTTPCQATSIARLGLGFDLSEINPHRLFQDLYTQEELGQVILDIREPDQKHKPIVITVTYPAESRSADYKKILYINQTTKLLTKLELYQRLPNNGNQHIRTAEFFDYNEPIDPAMFNFDNELPDNVTRIDQSDAEIGLVQGDRTDQEVAEELARQFFEAVTEQDFTKAGLFYVIGIPGYLLELEQNGFAALKGLEITSVGPTHPDTAPGSDAMITSCKGKIETDNGQIWKYNAYIRALPITDHPRRWVITGLSGSTVPVHEPITVPYNEADLRFDYNQSEDAIRTDQTDAEIGFVQGDLTNQQVAEKITRLLFEAVSKGDYAKTGFFSPDLPEFLAKQQPGIELLKGVEIMHVKPVQPDEPTAGSDAMISAYYGKSQYNGQTFNLNADVYVRPIASRSGRWEVYRLSASILPDTEPIGVSYDQIDLSAVTYDGLVPGEFMLKWLALGPMPNQVPAQIDPSSEQGQQIAFETDSLDCVNFSPKVSIGNRDYEWALVESSYKTVDLNRLNKSRNDYQTAYVWAQIEMPEEKTVTLGIGSNDGIKVWLNGDLVHENFVPRVVIFDNDRVPVTFRKGTNHLVLKVQNKTGHFGFCCRILDE